MAEEEQQEPSTTENTEHPDSLAEIPGYFEVTGGSGHEEQAVPQPNAEYPSQNDPQPSARGIAEVKVAPLRRESRPKKYTRRSPSVANAVPVEIDVGKVQLIEAIQLGANAETYLDAEVKPQQFSGLTMKFDGSLLWISWQGGQLATPAANIRYLIPRSKN